VKYKVGDLVILRGKALSMDNNSYSIGVVLDSNKKRTVKEYDDLWCTKELIWEKVYKVLTQGKIVNVTYYDIKCHAK
jgi:hypothetical protein